MYHHTDAVLFEPEQCLVKRTFQSRTFYRLWFVEYGLVQPDEEEWYENTGNDDTRWYCVTGEFECNRTIVTVESSLNVWKYSNFNKYEPQCNWNEKHVERIQYVAEQKKI